MKKLKQKINKELKLIPVWFKFQFLRIKEHNVNITFKQYYRYHEMMGKVKTFHKQPQPNKNISFNTYKRFSDLENIVYLDKKGFLEHLKIDLRPLIEEDKMNDKIKLRYQARNCGEKTLKNYTNKINL